jgi:hypothetical protein
LRFAGIGEIRVMRPEMRPYVVRAVCRTILPGAGGEFRCIRDRTAVHLPPARRELRPILSRFARQKRIRLAFALRYGLGARVRLVPDVVWRRGSASSNNASTIVLGSSDPLLNSLSHCVQHPHRECGDQGCPNYSRIATIGERTGWTAACSANLISHCLACCLTPS